MFAQRRGGSLELAKSSAPQSAKKATLSSKRSRVELRFSLTCARLSGSPVVAMLAGWTSVRSFQGSQDVSLIADFESQVAKLVEEFRQLVRGKRISALAVRIHVCREDRADMGRPAENAYTRAEFERNGLPG